MARRRGCASVRQPLSLAHTALQLLVFAAIGFPELGRPHVATAYTWQMKGVEGAGRAWLPGVVVRSVLDTSVASEALMEEMAMPPPPSAPLAPPLHRPRTGFTVDTEVAGIAEFAEVADLRLSVFTPYPDGPIRQKLRVRAREKMIEVGGTGHQCLIQLVSSSCLKCAATPTPADGPAVSSPPEPVFQHKRYPTATWPRLMSPRKGMTCRSVLLSQLQSTHSP